MAQAFSWIPLPGYLEEKLPYKTAVEDEETIAKILENQANEEHFVDENGKLGYVQAIGASPENVKAADNQEYGSGAFLMVASEMYKFAEREK